MGLRHLKHAGAPDPDGGLTVRLRVRPRSPAPGVDGTHDGALVVRVAEPPAEGRANEAVRRAVAAAFGVPRRDVRLVAGTRSAAKTVVVAGDPVALAARLADLQATAGTTTRGSGRR